MSISQIEGGENQRFLRLIDPIAKGRLLSDQRLIYQKNPGLLNLGIVWIQDQLKHPEVQKVYKTIVPQLCRDSLKGILCPPSCKYIHSYPLNYVIAAENNQPADLSLIQSQAPNIDFWSMRGRYRPLVIVEDKVRTVTALP